MTTIIMTDAYHIEYDYVSCVENGYTVAKKDGSWYVIEL